MIIYNKLDNYFFVSAARQTFLGFEMTANLRENKVSQDAQNVCALTKAVLKVIFRNVMTVFGFMPAGLYTIPYYA